MILQLPVVNHRLLIYNLFLILYNFIILSKFIVIISLFITRDLWALYYILNLLNIFGGFSSFKKYCF